MDDDDKPKPVFAPDEQSLLPGYKRYVSQKPKDWRAWSDGRGNKIDAPRRVGPSFGGKTIAPLVGADGQPIRVGSFQIIRDTRGVFAVIDWSRPVSGEEIVVEGDERKERPQQQSGIMGKEVFRHKDLRRAGAAMLVLHRDAEADAGKLPHDPAPCTDDRGKEIRSGDVALCQYARGPGKGKFAIVDYGPRPRRIFDVEAKNKKAAFRVFMKESARRAVDKPKPAVRGAPIAFDVPTGFGGGGATFSRSWNDKTYPEEGSESWRICVGLYAQTGKWCRTANMIWGDARPDAIEFEAAAAREEFLKTSSAQEEPKDDPKALRAMKKLKASEKGLLNEILEFFDGALLEVKLP
ncbi:MAG TPA: hypothetical protein VFA98_11800 [Thermoanaerobaculia bacterium]|nr:hypothetical protein [Thermoanaerobaculia bacterium]